MARIAKIEVKRCIIAYMKDLILQSRLLFSADSHSFHEQTALAPPSPGFCYLTSLLCCRPPGDDDYIL